MPKLKLSQYIKQNSWSLSLAWKIHTELILFKMKVVSISESLSRGHISQIKAIKEEYTFFLHWSNHIGLQIIMPKKFSKYEKFINQKH